MKIKDFVAAVERIAPLALAQDWDNVGLLVGDDNNDVKKILMTIDVTRNVVNEAKKMGAGLILSYHPVIWDGIKKITAAGETEAIYELVRAGISVYSIHTALDVAQGGVNDGLAEMVGIVDAEPIGDYVENPEGPGYKIVVFVPVAAAGKLADALYLAGAGNIGNYSHCGFQTQGVGTFLPLEGAKPAVGKKGKLEKIEELRLETVVSAGKVAGCVAAMRKAHPYEEPAFDVFRHYDMECRLGLGRIGKLSKATSVSDIIERIKKVTGASAVGVVGKEKPAVRKAAVCAGSCGKLINRVIAEKCDLYVTGELKHHQALAAQEAGLTCLCLSHTVSERFILKKLAKKLQKAAKDVTIRISRKDADPFRWKNI